MNPSSPPAAAGRSLGRLDRILLLGGVAVFVWLVARLGVGEVLANLQVAGWGIVPVIAQEILAYTANTAGWWASFRTPRPRIPLHRLLEARIVGDAVNYLTPTAGLGGEFARAHYLRPYASAKALAASVTVAKLTQFAGQVLYLAVGLALVLSYTSLDPGVRTAMTGGLLLLAAGVIGLVLAQRRGLFTPVLHGVRRVGFVRHRPGLAERLERLDAEIAGYHRDGGQAFLWSTLAFAIGWALGIVEMALLLWLLGIEVTLPRVVAIEVLSIAFDSLLFFVPAKAGTQEAGKVLVFTLLGLDPAQGLAVGILRRVRELAWAGLGIALWWRRG